MSHRMFITCYCDFRCVFYFLFFFNDTATTEIYTTDTLFPYTTLFRSQAARVSMPSATVVMPSLRARPMLDETMARAAGSWAAGPTKRRSIFISSKRSEEHTSELQSLMRISYAVFCLTKKKHIESYCQTYHILTHITH